MVQIYNPVTGSGIFSAEGFDPTVAVLKPTATGSGRTYPPTRLGQVIRGSEGTMWILAQLVLGSATDLLPGQAYQIDSSFTATLTSTATAVVGRSVGICYAFMSQAAAGTYAIWLAQGGYVGVLTEGTPAVSGIGETTATAGTLGFPATPTGNSTSVSPSGLLGTSGTVTATTVNGSPTIVATTQSSLALIGATLSGTGIPANTAIGAVRKQGSGLAIDMVASNSGHYLTAQNATASGSVTVTIAGTLAVNLADTVTHGKVN